MYETVKADKKGNYTVLKIMAYDKNIWERIYKGNTNIEEQIAYKYLVKDHQTKKESWIDELDFKFEVNWIVDEEDIFKTTCSVIYKNDYRNVDFEVVDKIVIPVHRQVFIKTKVLCPKIKIERVDSIYRRICQLKNRIAKRVIGNVRTSKGMQGRIKIKLTNEELEEIQKLSESTEVFDIESMFKARNKNKFIYEVFWWMMEQLKQNE